MEESAITLEHFAIRIILHKLYKCAIYHWLHQSHHA